MMMDCEVVGVTFTDPGALGMRLAPNRHTGRTEVAGINAGTQAEQHPGLRVGLALAAVGGESVSGRSYREVVSML
eukprot:COSAG05_NODE_13629_length_423_cov_0.645062_1_plen_74_part_01